MKISFAERTLDAEALLELEDVALTVVHELGRTGLALFEEAHRTIEFKRDTSIVTQGDRAIESQARQLLVRLTPDFGFSGEELGSVKRLADLRDADDPSVEPKTAIQQLESLHPFERDINTEVSDALNQDVDTFWLLDPIDGTQSFVANVPTWSILLALVHRGKPVLGVVALPCVDQVFVASSGNGSHHGALSGARNSFRPCVVRPTVSLEDAIIATGKPKAFQHRGLESWLINMLARPGRTEQYTDAFGYTRILTGHIDAMVDPLAAAHELAAIQVLFTETPGAFFSSLHGQANHNTFKKGSAIASCCEELCRNILTHLWRHASREAQLSTLRPELPTHDFFERFNPTNDRLFGQHREMREWAQALEMAVARFKMLHCHVVVEDLSVIGELREQHAVRLKNSAPEGPPSVIRREGVHIRAVVAGGTGLVTSILPEQTAKVDLIAQALNMALDHSREQGNPTDREILAYRPQTCGHFGNLSWGEIPDAGAVAEAARDFAREHSAEKKSEVRLLQTLFTQSVQHRFQIFLDGSQQTVSTGASLLRVRATSSRDDEKRAAGRVRFASGLPALETLRNLHTVALREASRESVALLDAEYVPEDLEYDYLAIDADLLGLILHEALGHALEGDLIELGQSGLGKDGRLQPLSVAPDWMNVVVDGNLTNCGYSPIDYEGTPACRKTLVRKGKLVEAIHTRETALRMGHTAEGSARAQSVLFPSLNRMTSIWIQADPLLPLSLPDGISLTEAASPETLRDVLVEQGFLTKNKRVAYLAGWTGGTASGSNLEFRADVRTVHLLTADKKPLLMRQANFTGVATACFQSAIAAFGPVLCRTFGTCGKDGQGVPTADGGPMILLLAKHPQVRVIGSGDSE
jgi:TldD protein